MTPKKNQLRSRRLRLMKSPKVRKAKQPSSSPTQQLRSTPDKITDKQSTEPDTHLANSSSKGDVKNESASNSSSSEITFNNKMTFGKIRLLDEYPLKGLLSTGERAAAIGEAVSSELIENVAMEEKDGEDSDVDAEEIITDAGDHANAGDVIDSSMKTDKRSERMEDVPNFPDVNMKDDTDVKKNATEKDIVLTEGYAKASKDRSVTELLLSDDSSGSSDEEDSNSTEKIINSMIKETDNMDDTESADEEDEDNDEDDSDEETIGADFGKEINKTASKGRALSSSVSKAAQAEGVNNAKIPKEAVKLDDQLVTGKSKKSRKKNRPLFDLVPGQSVAKRETDALKEQLNKPKVSKDDKKRRIGKSEKTTEKDVSRDQGNEQSKRGVLYLGHIPHGFYENEMRKYFSQFGTVCRLRLSRSQKTGNSRGYAFIEFEDEEIAPIAAEAMDGYLMLGSRLVANVMSPEKIHEDIFKPRPPQAGSLKKSLVERQALISRSFNPQKVAARSMNIVKKVQAKKERLAKIGINYKFPTVPDHPKA